VCVCVCMVVCGGWWVVHGGWCVVRGGEEEVVVVVSN